MANTRLEEKNSAWCTPTEEDTRDRENRGERNVSQSQGKNEDKNGLAAAVFKTNEITCLPGAREVWAPCWLQSVTTGESERKLEEERKATGDT